MRVSRFDWRNGYHGCVPWFKITFMVEIESEEEFDSQFDEDRVAAALPGKIAYLAWIEESPTVSARVRARWRKLRRASES